MFIKTTGISVLFKSTFIYSVSSFARKGIHFLLLPLYTNALAASGYGALSLLMVLGSACNMILNLGLVSALTVYYKDLEDKKKGENTVIISITATSVIFMLIIFPIASIFAEKIVKVDGSKILIQLYLILTVIQLLNNIFYAFLRLRFQNVRHVIISNFTVVSTTLLVMYFVLVEKQEVKGVLIGMLIPSVLTLVYFLFAFGVKPQFDRTIIKKLFKFGIWIVPINLAGLILGLSDRFFIQAYFSIKEVGIYSLAYKFAALITVFFLAPFRQSFGPYIFQKSPNLGKGINSGLKFFLILGTLGFLIVSLPNKAIITIMATDEFLPASRVISFLLISNLLMGLSQIFAVGIHKAGKSYIGTCIVFFCANLNIALNFLLIPRYSILGAALATLISYFIMTMLYLYFSKREIKISLEKLFLVKLLTITTIIYFSGKFFLPLIENILVKIIIFFSFLGIFLILAFLILSRNEQEKILVYLKKIKRSYFSWLPKRKKIIEASDNKWI